MDRPPRTFDELKSMHVSLPEVPRGWSVRVFFRRRYIEHYVTTEMQSFEPSVGDPLIDVVYQASYRVETMTYEFWSFEHENESGHCIIRSWPPPFEMGCDENFGLTPEQLVVAFHYDLV